MTDRELIEKHCKEECLFKGDCCSSCSLSKLRNINYGIFLVDHNKQEYNIDSEIDYTKKYTHLHINPKELSLINCDYYVKIEDLVISNNDIDYKWSITSVEESNFSEVNGKYLTSLMVNSPAARYVRRLGGFIGSMIQMNFLIGIYEKLKQILYFLGYTIDYKYSELWSSTQKDTKNAYAWHDDWVGFDSENEFSVIPFFDKI